MSIKALSDYTIYAKYARYNPEKQRRETWQEQVDRVFGMHERKFKSLIDTNPEFKAELEFAKEQVYKKRVLGSQRSLQFGGEQIEKHNAKIYNCAFGYVSRVEAFSEMMYLLLCGVGVGFSVQTHHIQMLPDIKPRTGDPITHVIDDSIEGWSNAIRTLLDSYFIGYNVEFDYTQIRPEGSIISGGFKAPGYKGLKNSIDNIVKVIDRQLNLNETRLRSIDCYDVIMHMSDAVLSGGVRRSATICLFSPDDDLMINAKTGRWYIENPQRGRSNNSALLLRGETTREQFAKLIKSTKEFGEPGFVWADSTEIGYNPCVEIGLYPVAENGEHGIQFCNLTEINGKFCTSEEKFLQACRASAIIGTLQASYTDFRYVSDATKRITDREALLGCSITGMMDNPEVLFNPDIQRKGAEEIKRVNKLIAEMIGINPAARCTALKPAGTTSCVLGTASGIHPHHARRYIRRVQANKLEFPAQYFQQQNPLAVEDSVWSNNGTDVVISFLCEVPAGAIIKNQLKAIELLDRVKLTQQNWVEFGTNEEHCRLKNIRHNVSNTITVKSEEWDEVEEYIYTNRQWFAGISLLASSGDKDYPQAPFTTVHTPTEIVSTYGDASIFASGLIVDGLRAFNNNLWKACDTVLGFGEDLSEPIWDDPNTEVNAAYAIYEAQAEKRDWVRRGVQFAERYFDGDMKKMTYCLKDVYIWKQWCDLSREYKDINWSDVVELTEHFVDIDTVGAQACAGGKCEVAW